MSKKEEIEFLKNRIKQLESRIEIEQSRCDRYERHQDEALIKYNECEKMLCAAQSQLDIYRRLVNANAFGILEDDDYIIYRGGIYKIDKRVLSDKNRATETLDISAQLVDRIDTEDIIK